ncbi:pyrimidine-nucleoside phosphorylase [Cellulosilyticum sp. I15G10I2]|uniref:pyrimidine-nucleoside phosphorylase n=1 Tax=Cellulosilyticum sp. I15G10I2 TaxID=1892843 RepID=UPI00085C32CE|nr:pyrimidine-nucleoside phosphorylase [Cellulosilyticum sp. I15G10I2]
MRMYEIIEHKKKGKALSKEEIDYVIQGYTSGIIPDYQMSALLMAIYFKGMNIEETSDLTLAMAKSGNMMDLSLIRGIKVDKHSTGGVGDKTTIVLGPLVAAAGVKVAKMSGRGLGHTGGTIDKLEAIPGFKVELTMDQFVEHVNKHHIAVVSQSGNLAPADKKIYALRDVTATVDNISLIASSIMSKKIASGAEAIVLDVKCGSGAFMKETEEAVNLAEVMVDIGNQVGRKTVAVISDMNQPLGYAVGNALEVKEAIETLKGHGPKDLTELTITLASHMLVLGEVCSDIKEAEIIIKEIIKNGKAIDKLKEWIALQGGDVNAVDNYELLGKSKYTEKIILEDTGYVYSINAEEIGRAALVLGAGRENKTSVIDLTVGVVIHKKIGDYIREGEAIATIYYNETAQQKAARSILTNAYVITQEVPKTPQLIYKFIG